MNEEYEYSHYQDELIGILANVPNYFKRTLLRKEYFDKKHGVMFEIMQGSYRDNGVILHELLLADKRVSDQEYMNCISNVIHKYSDYFDALEKYAIDEYKKRVILDNAMKLQSKTISIDEFNSINDSLNRLGVVKGNKLTEKSILDTLSKKEETILFKKFPSFGEKLKSTEQDFIVIAGKTGAGKTAFALNLLCDLSETYPCLYFNMEMSEQALIQRITSLTSNLKFSNVKKFSTLPQNAIDVIKRNAKTLGNRDIEIKSGSQTIDRIKKYVGSFDNKGKHFIVFIDHMGLISARGKTSYEVATKVAKDLRRLALNNNCTVISLCQLSREADKAQNPSLSLLRDSGEIEQSARKVIFVWENNKRYSLCIEKNDSGALATIPVNFIKDKQIFQEIKKDIRE